MLFSALLNKIDDTLTLSSAETFENNFHGTPLEREIEVLNKKFASIAFENQNQLNIIKYYYVFSTNDLDTLSFYKSNCRTTDVEKLINLIQKTNKDLISRTNRLLELNQKISIENETIIKKLEKLSHIQITRRNQVLNDQEIFKGLKEKKILIQKEYNESLGFFIKLFPIFKNSNVTIKLEEIEKKINDMKEGKSEIEMAEFIEKTKVFEDKIFRTSVNFIQFRSYLWNVKIISDELLKINYLDDPDLVERIDEKCRLLLKSLLEVPPK